MWKNNDGGTVEQIWWSSGTVEEIWWNSGGDMVEQCNSDWGTQEQLW